MSDMALEDIDITGTDEHPVTSSVKLNGPPGTGKTTESAARVAKLIDEHDYKISDVLWATYRKSLALETLERLADWDIIADEELNDPTEGDTRFIATIHGIANRLIGGIGDIPTWYDKKTFANKRNLKYKKSKPWEEPPGQLLFDVFTYAANNKLDLNNLSDREQVPGIDDFSEANRDKVGRWWNQWQDHKDDNSLYEFWEQLALATQARIPSSSTGLTCQKSCSIQRGACQSNTGESLRMCLQVHTRHRRSSGSAPDASTRVSHHGLTTSRGRAGMCQMSLTRAHHRG